MQVIAHHGDLRPAVAAFGIPFHTVDDLRELGRDIERNVLARAVRWHLEDRIIVDQDRTVVLA